MNDDDDAVSDLEWKNRVLCGDESCIGVIGPDGRCKECGKPYDGDLPAAQTGSDDDASNNLDPIADSKAAIDELDGGRASEKTTDPSDEDDEWRQRILCKDEACIGVIGPDGRCKECGLPFGP